MGAPPAAQGGAGRRDHGRPKLPARRGVYQKTSDHQAVDPLSGSGGPPAAPPPPPIGAPGRQEGVLVSLPEKDRILAWIRDNPDRASKRDIARAFGIKGTDRVELKRVLRELAEEGHVARAGKKRPPAGHLPAVTVLVGSGADRDGELLARPVKWTGEGDPPPILYVPSAGDPALGEGDRFLAKLHPVHEAEGLRYEARLVKKLQGGPRRVLGVFRLTDGGGRLIPVEKGADELRVEPHDAHGAEDGELVEAEPVGPQKFGLRRARIVERLGDPGAPRAVSLIAIHHHRIPVAFSEAALAEAEAAAPAAPDAREDLRDLPLVTIDPADARDHDDAVCALPDPAVEGGWLVWVAIADVAHYVTSGSALDRDARRRGNSAYFPDRVAPMLPEALSGDLCSLHEGVDRACVAVRLTLAPDGRVSGHRFTRGMMRSRASLTYAQAQAIEEEGAEHPLSGPVRRLFAAYRCALGERGRRAPLELDLPERRIELDAEGRVAAIAFRERVDAHRLIEEFMILANVAAAEALETKRRPLIYRVHEEPAEEKLESLRESMETIGYAFPKGEVVQTRHFNRLLEQARGGEFEELVNLSVLRAQTQAYYSPENFGHFGLNLRSYAHFTSPIRRYADLVVHRALISAHRWGDDGLSAEEADALKETAEHISMTERRAMEAERDTTDRYLALYLAEREGAEFAGRISGVARFGLFVKLDETGADGIVPVATLGREYWRFDPDQPALVGEKSGRVLGLGSRARVRLVEVAPVQGALRFELLEVEEAPIPKADRGRGGRGPKRKLDRARIAAAKAKKRHKSGQRARR